MIKKNYQQQTEVVEQLRAGLEPQSLDVNPDSMTFQSPKRGLEGKGLDRMASVT